MQTPIGQNVIVELEGKKLIIIIPDIEQVVGQSEKGNPKHATTEGFQFVPGTNLKLSLYLITPKKRH